MLVSQLWVNQQSNPENAYYKEVSFTPLLPSMERSQKYELTRTLDQTKKKLAFVKKALVSIDNREGRLRNDEF